MLAVLGWALNAQQFGYSWLFAYMFFLSFCLGALFLVLVHHLFDAGAIDAPGKITRPDKHRSDQKLQHRQPLRPCRPKRA